MLLKVLFLHQYCYFKYQAILYGIVVKNHHPVPCCYICTAATLPHAVMYVQPPSCPMLLYMYSRHPAPCCYICTAAILPHAVIYVQPPSCPMLLYMYSRHPAPCCYICTAATLPLNLLVLLPATYTRLHLEVSSATTQFHEHRADNPHRALSSNPSL